MIWTDCRVAPAPSLRRICTENMDSFEHVLCVFFFVASFVHGLVVAVGRVGRTGCRLEEEPSGKGALMVIC